MQGHDLPQHVLVVALKVEVVQGASVAADHPIADVGLDGGGASAAQAVDCGYVVDNFWQEDLQFGLTANQIFPRNSGPHRDIKAHSDVNTAAYRRDKCGFTASGTDKELAL